MSEKKSNFKFKERRYFSEAFKKEKVHEILTKKTTIRELSALYDLHINQVYNWIYKYSPESKNVKICYQMESEQEKTLYYKSKVAELERIIGSKQIEIEFLNQLIELASIEMDVDIKKNFSTRLLNISEKIHKKENLK